LIVLAYLAAAGVWTEHQLDWVRQRRLLAANHDVMHFFGVQIAAPFPLGLFGEAGESGILVHTDSPEVRQKIIQLFPEARIVRVDWGHADPRIPED
jgi:hypothetical protein